MGTSDRVIEAPLRRKPGIQRLGCRCELLLDARATSSAGELGMRDARILVGFAEEVLAIDQL